LCISKSLESLTIKDKVYKVQFFLGGDWKFLAVVCVLEAATCEYACVWCKCPKHQRWDMSLAWSITDQPKVLELLMRSQKKLSLERETNKEFNCCRRAPLFSFIPMHCVVIDSLHLFLRIADVLSNLLIRDLRIVDGIEKATGIDLEKSKTTNVKAYEMFLNDSCKIRFQWYTDKETKQLSCRGLTGPEKIRT